MITMNKRIFSNVVMLCIGVSFAAPALSADNKLQKNKLVNVEKEITLEKIMSDPSWMGQSPMSSKWLPDSTHIVYEQAQKDSTVRKQFRLDTRNSGVKEVNLAEFHKTKMRQITYNGSQSKAAYVFAGDIYLWDQLTSKVDQLTATSDSESSPQFLSDGRVAYWVNNRFVAVDPNTKVTNEVFKVEMSKEPEAPKGPNDIIAEEQHKLIKYVSKQHKNAVERFEHNKEINSKNKFANKAIFYFGEDNVLNEAKVSPSADKAIIVVSKRTPWRDSSDVMPNYIADDGRIEIEKVRRRVADAKPVQQEFWLVDLQTGKKHELKINTLPDFDKDVLRSVKEENAIANGEKYVSKKATRTINLISDWTWSQSAIQWHRSGEQVAVMFESWDNKDRWLATVDFKNKKFINQHQLHDDAWINYTFNDFGWFNHSNKLYFLSEQSGYSHLYVKQLGKKNITQLTAGEYEVSNVRLSNDDTSVFFKANVNHPGEYHIYKTSTGKTNIEKPNQITKLVGLNDYQLSPDESKLLIEHSSLLKPTELFLIDLKTGNTKQLTDTVSEAFVTMPWTKPEIVAVPSSNTDKPIYARVYYPKDYKAGQPRKAVIFNHGAGYLQNSHKGFSGYFREFMFHSLLAQQGYVVMDMDYRASKGYGRDWRTAIYRQMGTPEIEDLVDGVDWLV